MTNAVYPNEATYRDIDVILCELGPHYRGSRGLLIPGGGVVARQELTEGMMQLFPEYQDPLKARG